MEPEKYILTVDLGTSGPKVALFTTGGESLGYEFEPVSLILKPNGGAEQDPHEWWSAITRASRRLIARNLVPVDAIIALACTAQWSGTVPVDRSGEPLMNAIIWMDSRGEPYIKRLTGGGIEIEGYNVFKLWTWMSRTGGVPGHSGKDSIAHILWLKHEQPAIYQAAYKFLEPVDYLNLKLTGEFATTQAHILLHWVTDNRDINHIVYDPTLIRLSTLDPDKLPALRGCVDILGPLTQEAAAELGLHERVQVVVGTSDVHSAAIGSGAVRDYEANLYIGTSSWLTCHVPFKKTDLFHNQASLPSGIPGRYLLTNEQECAGQCLNYLRDNILINPEQLVKDEQVKTVYQAFDKMAERVKPGSDRVIFTPWLYGERTPVEDHHVRGGFFNLSLDTRREHLARAVLEGVAFNARWLLDAVEKFNGRRLDEIHFIGGGAYSATWSQIVADVLNRPILQVHQPGLSNARGAAYIAAIALHCLTWEQIPERIRIAHTYTPNPEHRAYYDDTFKQFVNIYKANGKIYRSLNRRSALSSQGQS